MSLGLAHGRRFRCDYQFALCRLSYRQRLADASNFPGRRSRKRGRTPTDCGEDLMDHEYRLESRHDAPDRGIERSERADQVHSAIAKLAPDLRECVILRDIEELTYQEIVDILKIPIGTVKSRINRGRIELAKILRRMKVVEVI